jgi:zinc transport system substrate-binding protein
MKLATGLSLAQGLALPALLFAGTAQSADAPVVVTSIKPVHSLVAAIMEGVGKPELIVDGAASPHTYTMKPSNASALQSAKVVFWVGPGLEAFLEKPLEALGTDASIAELDKAQGLTKLKFREGGAFEPHDDGDEHDATIMARKRMATTMPRLTTMMHMIMTHTDMMITATANSTRICGSTR